MCRWLAYSGSPIYLEQLLFLPRHSLIDQSLSADQGETTTNGDGFGIGWFDSRERPGVYRDIQPAWNDSNLRDLAHQIRSRLFLALSSDDARAVVSEPFGELSEYWEEIPESSVFIVDGPDIETEPFMPVP